MKSDIYGLFLNYYSFHANIRLKECYCAKLNYFHFFLEKLLVTDYVLRRFPNMEEPETEDMKAIYMIIKDWYTLKHSEENVEEVCKLIEKLGATYRNVNSKFVSSQEVSFFEVLSL